MDLSYQMKQQLNVLNNIEKVITEAEEKGLTGSTSVEDRSSLKKYCEDMKQACKTALEIGKLVEATRAEEDAKKAKEDAQKAKKDTAKKVKDDIPEKTAPKKDTASEKEKTEDDLSFLD